MSNKSLIDELQLASLLESALREEPSGMLTKEVMNRLLVAQQREAQTRLESTRYRRVAVSVGSLLLLLLGLLLVGLTSSMNATWSSTNQVWVSFDLDLIALNKINSTSQVTIIGLVCLASAIWFVGSIDRYHRFIRA